MDDIRPAAQISNSEAIETPFKSKYLSNLAMLDRDRCTDLHTRQTQKHFEYKERFIDKYRDISICRERGRIKN